MKKFERLLKGSKHICFLDFEGTQFSHEMIAIGATLVSIDHHGFIKKEKKPFKIYVKAKNKIGSYVTNLTGIDEALLKKEGVSFLTALNELKKYCGMVFKKCVFVTFGSHDMRILNQSISYSFDFPKDVCSQIQKHHVDFSAFLSEFIKDSKGNPLSLVHYCELFDVKEAGLAHDPSVDAINLAHLYDAVMKKGDIILQEYKKVLQNFNGHYPQPVAFAVSKLAKGETVTAEDFENEIRKYLA